MSVPNKPPPFTPSPPFCDPGRGDLILRSADGAAFYVHRVVLSLASPVFEDMFTVAWPDSKEEVPEVSMPHSGAVLDRVLRFFYPGAQPAVDNLGQLREILEIIIDRYGIESVVTHGRAHLRQYIVSQPVGAFAVAARHGWSDLAREAAKECLKLPLRASDYEAPEELRYVSGTTYQRLVQYHYRCGAAGRAACKRLEFRCTCARPVHCVRARPFKGGASVQTIFPAIPEWLTQYRDAMGEKIAVTPSRLQADNPLLLIQVLDKIGNCPSCGDVYSKQNFATYLAETGWPTIESEIAKVQFKFEL